jgi:hypothetical protein
VNSFGGCSGSLGAHARASAANEGIGRTVPRARHRGWRPGGVGKPAICSSASIVQLIGRSDAAATSSLLILHHTPSPPAMGLSDTITGLVDRLKPSNKSSSFSGIGSGNQGIVSFEDDVSSLLPAYRQCAGRVSPPVPRLTVPPPR